MLKTLYNLPNAALQLLLPKYCIVCEEENYISNKQICNKCLINLPVAPNSDYILNQMTDKFDRDEISIIGATSLISSSKDERYMNIIYKLKYNDFSYPAEELTPLLANKIKKEHELSNFNLIIPVPLHRLKERERGYNQSTIIGKILSKELNIEFSENILFRNRYTKTQTKLNKDERKQNLENAFTCNKELAKMKNIIIVDDVFTTGASINTASQALLQVGARSVISATMVFAGEK
jgi:ComF family protein